jgi:uncharacterized alkaline shock family protein YloU
MDTAPTTVTQGGPGVTHPGGETDRAAPPRSRGKTFIQDDVVSVIARIAAEQVPGVHQIGESSLRNIMARLGRHAGVEAEVGQQEAAVDVQIVVEFGFAIREVAEELRARVIDTVESMTGRRVVEVNVFVVDVHIPKVERKPHRNLE